MTTGKFSETRGQMKGDCYFCKEEAGEVQGNLKFLMKEQTEGKELSGRYTNTCGHRVFEREKQQAGTLSETEVTEKSKSKLSEGKKELPYLG